jgi:hypothetical protein
MSARGNTVGGNINASIWVFNEVESIQKNGKSIQNAPTASNM